MWDHLVPHRGNDHQPHALKHRVLAGYSVLLVLLKILALVAPVALPSSSLYSSAITQQNIVDLTNQTRQNLNLSELVVNDKLAYAAIAKANDMLQNQYFAHTSPGGVTPWSWMVQQGYQYRYAGENLAVHFTSAEGVQEGWLGSPSHRANIVNQNYTEIGVGVAMGEFEGFPTTFVVQMFGSPALAAAPVAAAVTVPPSKPAPAVVQPQSPTPSQPPVVAAAEQQSPPVTQPEPTPIPPPVVQPEPIPTLPPVTPSLTEPEPVVQEPELVLPALDESTVMVVQQDGYYDIRVTVQSAESVAAYLGTSWIQLVVDAKQPNVWSGHMPFDTTVLGQSGEQLSLVATSPDGVTARFALAWVAPQTGTQQFYTFNEGSDHYAKLFSFFTIHNLQDSVRQFYFYFMVFLAAALLINVLVKVRIQKLSIISHAVLVLALTVFLMVV